jgi:hypothetical protein
MTGPSTDRTPPPFEERLAELAKGADHYYLKSSSIVERIEHNGRVFYSKFRRIDRQPNAILLAQHLRREVTLALPLLHDGEGDRLVIEYLGEEPEPFLQTLVRLFQHLGLEGYTLFQGKRGARRTVLLPVPTQSLDSLHRLGGELSDMLQTRLPKSWRILPDRRLPESYNIYTLPYGYIN